MLAETLHLQALLVFAELPMQRLRLMWMVHPLMAASTSPILLIILRWIYPNQGINYGIFISKSSTASGVATIYSTNAGSGPGIYGQSASGDGAYGNSTNGYGVYGISSSSYGMYAYSSNYRALYAEGDPLYYTAYFNGDTYSTGFFTSALMQNWKEHQRSKQCYGHNQSAEA